MFTRSMEENEKARRSKSKNSRERTPLCKDMGASRGTAIVCMETTISSGLTYPNVSSVKV